MVEINKMRMGCMSKKLIFLQNFKETNNMIYNMNDITITKF